MTDLALVRGRRATINLTGLKAPDGSPATFSNTDVVLFTAKVDVGQPDTDALIAKSSETGGVIVDVSGDSATVVIDATDFADVILSGDITFEWDVSCIFGGVATQAARLASGDGTLSADISLNPSEGTDPLAGTTCSPWATNVDAVPPANVGVDPVELDLCMQISSDILYGLTRRRWPGVCSDKVYPSARYRAYNGAPRWWPSSARSVGSYPWGFCSCNRSRDLGCSRIPEIALPGRPVIPSSIVVKIDGNAFTAFELQDHNKLVRTDGDGWPCCQTQLLDDTEVGSWSIAYQFGKRPPIGGVRSAAVLGSQLAMAYHPDVFTKGECKLPKRVTSITRAGTTIAVLDPLTMFKDGLTGIPEVDLWVASTNAGDAGRRGRLINRRSTLRRHGV